MRALAGACLVMTAAAAQAQVLFQDDFESGTLLTTDTPPGQFNVSYATPTGNTLSASAAAAHRGNLGMELVDTHTGSAGGEGADGYGITGTTQPFYSRFWFQLATSNNKGTFSIHELKGFPSGSNPHVWLQIANPGGQLQLIVRDDSLASTTNPAGTVAVGTWYLLEVVATGAGTSNGAAALYVNGALIAQQSGVAWTTAQHFQFTAGEPYSTTNQFTGNLFFDDVRLSTSPNASTLLASAAGPAVVGQCVPVTVSLVDSISAAPAAAPYPVTATLSAVGVNGTWFSDSACGTPTTTVTIPSGASSAQTYFVPSSVGTATLSASQADFVAGSAATLAVGSPDGGASDSGAADAGSSDAGSTDSGAPDAGPSGTDAGKLDAGPPYSGPPRVEAVGCGCGASGPGGALCAVLLGLALALRGGRSRGRAARRRSCRVGP